MIQLKAMWVCQQLQNPNWTAQECEMMLLLKVRPLRFSNTFIKCTGAQKLFWFQAFDQNEVALHLLPC